MSSLIEKYLTLKNNYRNYDTIHALKRMQAFRRAVQELSTKGYPLAIELLGSISFGIVEPNSDADCVIFHFCDLHKEDGECTKHCPNLIFEQGEIVRYLSRRLKDEMFNIEFLDCINLKYIDSIINEGIMKENNLLYSMLYYRIAGRPVNRPLLMKYCKILEKDEEFMKGFVEWSSQILSAYLKTSTHRLSFSKYNERIISKGLVLPDDLKEELRKYLE